MGWTKRQFIDTAYDEIGLGPAVYDIQADDYTTSLRVMDAMVATWQAKKVSIGYPIEETPSEADLDDVTEVPVAANAAIYLNLAIHRARSLGKTVSPDLKQQAHDAYEAMAGQFAEIPVMDFSSVMPRGSGNRRGVGFRRRFFGTPSKNDSGKANDNVIQGKET